MTEREVIVHLAPTYEGLVDRERLERLARVVLELAGEQEGRSLAVVVTDDEEVQRLNCLYRGGDYLTDVLAFGGGGGEGFVSSEEEKSHLGDVLISYPRAVEQAQEYGHSTCQELELLLVHGILHLLGYEDHTPSQRSRMWTKQKELLEQARLLLQRACGDGQV